MEADDLYFDVQSIDAGYGEIEVLKDVSIQVGKGKIVSILGANGAGKSTLLKTLFGLVKATKGHVFVNGKDFTKKSSADRIQSGIAYVAEGRSNFQGMTVEENLEMGAITRSDRDEIQNDIDALCERFPILAEKRKITAGNLSGGQQQMLEIAIAMMLRPRVLLIDEPTLGLAPILVTEVFDELLRINAKGTTIVLVEQNAKRALEISNYAYVLELGAVRFQGPAEKLSKDEEIIQAYLGER